MEDKELIMKLLYQALIEIREEAHSKGDKKIFLLSDLLHNIPLKLTRAVESEDYRVILDYIKVRAESRDMDSWLKNTLSQS
jgi:hypothetical protein